MTLYQRYKLWRFRRLLVNSKTDQQPYEVITAYRRGGRTYQVLRKNEKEITQWTDDELIGDLMLAEAFNGFVERCIDRVFGR